MREIKFRLWDKKFKNMFYASNPGIQWEYGNLTFGLQEYKDEQDWTTYIEDVILMQYTGLKDKNGKEIYEGDIVDFTYFDAIDNDTRYIGIVRWVEEEALFSIVDSQDKDYFLGDLAWLGGALRADSELEVIGNIYQHPELVQQ